MAEITNISLREIEAEYVKWSEFLNVGIGLLSFSLGISCLGTPIPGITAFFSLLFMLMFMIYGQKQFPRKLRELRKASLVGIDEVALLGIERKYFGLEFAGGLYHLTSRGDGREDIYRGDDDRKVFLDLFAQVCGRFNWRAHAYCLMTNHYHLLVETPDGNLSKGKRIGVTSSAKKIKT